VSAVADTVISAADEAGAKATAATIPLPKDRAALVMSALLQVLAMGLLPFDSSPARKGGGGQEDRGLAAKSRHR
jgi:hypothetical protein